MSNVLRLIELVSPSFRDAYDATAFFVHATFLEKGFKLRSLGESGDDQELGAAPPAWNASADAYCFRYTHPSHPGAIYLVKLLRMDQLLMAYAVRKDDGGRVLTLELNVADACDASLAAAPAPPHRAYRNADSILSKVDSTLVQPILPASASASSQASPSAAASSVAAEQRVHPQVRRDPLRADDDDYDPLRIGPVRRPQPRLGDFDGDFGPAGLGPMGMGGPLGGRFGPGGSLMGPDHPIFAGPRGGGHPGMGGGYGMGGGGRGGMGMRGGRGRGVRYDPVHPFGRGDPDRDDMPPPGPDSWFG